MASTLETCTITAECLCKAHIFSTTFPTSQLPLLAHACHCSSCRHLTGALYFMNLPWPEPRQNVDTTKLAKYRFSANYLVLFCQTCSTPLFFESAKESHDLNVFTGTLKNHDVDLVKIVDHIFVEDTIDGGATMWLRKPNADGSEAHRFKKRQNSKAYPYNWPPNSSFTGYEKKIGVSSIPIQCHCKGVSLSLHDGNYENKTKEQLPWFIDPKTYKPIASFDTCNSCRLQSGIDIFHWTFAELAHISFSPASQQGAGIFPNTTHDLKAAVDAQDVAIGSLAYYQSSPEVQRYFCKVCSATVFYALDERPEIVDVAIGLLHAPDGARAECFLSWTLGGAVSWLEDTNEGWREGLMKRVTAESEEWRIQRGYPKNWRRLM